jgi:transcriptional regulator with XRE-family HTH domain
MSETLGERIQRVLQEAPFAMRQLAAEAGLSYDVLRSWRSGRRRPSRGSAARLAAGLQGRGELLLRLAAELREASGAEAPGGQGSQPGREGEAAEGEGGAAAVPDRPAAAGGRGSADGRSESPGGRDDGSGRSGGGAPPQRGPQPGSGTAGDAGYPAGDRERPAAGERTPSDPWREGGQGPGTGRSPFWGG